MKQTGHDIIHTGDTVCSHGYRWNWRLLGIVLPCLSLAVAGCGSSGSSGSTAPDAEASQTAETAAASDTAADEAALAASTETAAEEATEQADAGDFSYAELEGYEFQFASGVGAWGTELTIASDGTFSGAFHDSDMGDADENEYPNGTYYWCGFEGKLSDPVRVNDYAYQMTIEDITYEDVAGTEEVIDGLRYCYSEPYGLDGATKLHLYLPGTPMTELSNNVIGWLEGSSSLEGSRLTYYALVSLPKEEAFSSNYYGDIEGDGRGLAQTVTVENPSWSYYLSDQAQTESLVGYTLDKLTQESNKITDDDQWLSENELTDPGTSYIKGDYTYELSDWDQSPSVTVTDQWTGEAVCYDLSAYAMAPDYDQEYGDYVDQHVLYAEAESGILYVATGHITSASICSETAYITAIDMASNSVLWKSAPLTCNAKTFVIVDDYIVCGYGFTAEKDYLNVIRKDNGVLQEQVLLKSAPEYIFLKDGILYVRCYDTNYTFQMAMG